MTSVLLKRLADPDDPLRTLLEVGREWHVPPTVVLGERTVRTNEWTSLDVDYMVALKVFERGLCPGGDHLLSETSKPEHAGAYRPGAGIRCHKCKAEALQAEVMSEAKESAGLFIPLVLDAEIVELNKKPAPPLPPELGGE